MWETVRKSPLRGRQAAVLLPVHWEWRAWAVVGTAVALFVVGCTGALRWNSHRRRQMLARLRCEHFDKRSARKQQSPRGNNHRRTGVRVLSPLQALSPTPEGNWLTSPPRYLPPPDTTDKVLSIRESADVRDGSYSWQGASALLDTGNQHCTVVDAAYAARHGLYTAEHDSHFGQAERWTTLRGVVPGATSRVPVITVQLRIRGQVITVPCAISALGSEDLLVGVDVLSQLFAAGFRIESAG